LDEVQTASEQTIWEAETYNVRGQIKSYLLGDDYRTTRTWDYYGFPHWIKTAPIAEPTEYIQRAGYDFNPQRGNLIQRESWTANYFWEDYEYDALDRLTDETILSNTLETSYASNGNITNRSDVGDFNYVGSGPHAVTGLENTTGTLLPTSDQTVDYTSFNKASHISQGNLDYFITYGPDRLRRYTNLRNDITEDALLTKYYAFGDYEKATDADGTRHLHYISGGDGLAAIYVKYDYAPDSIYFIMKDHLGSIVGAINEETGTVFRQSFDAWGRNRNPENWTYTNIPDFIFDRGYTGHEHLKWFGLINMNGRMYDAGLCRFLSPDPYVQMPDYSQNFNRYSYALNNPLIFVDPDGEFVIAAFLIGMAVTAAIDYGMQVAMNYAAGYRGNDAWFNKVDFFDVAVSGAIGGLTVGFGASLKAGHSVGKFGMFMASNSGWITAGEIAVTSGIDITGEGWQPVSGNDFGKRVVIGGATWGASKLLGKAFKGKNSSMSVEQKVIDNIEDATDGVTQGNNVVYQGIDKASGEVKYVGITKRAPDVRFGEHLGSNTEKALLDYRVVPGATKLNRIDARILEQTLINQYGLNKVLNLRNSIAPKYWWLYGIKQN
nr:RHS repeat-associated core domain-containing protein [Bacteroidota bacterium]